MSRRMRRLFLGLLCVAVGAGMPALAAAHGNGLPWIYLEDEIIQPGVSFHVLVIDYPPHATVELEAVMGEVTAALGALPTEADGHGEADVMLPDDFPYGYGELYGRSADGTEAYALIQVGDRSGAQGPPAPRRTPIPTGAASAPQLWEDPSVLLLAGLVVGAALLLTYRLSQRRRASQPRKSRRGVA